MADSEVGQMEQGGGDAAAGSAPKDPAQEFVERVRAEFARSRQRRSELKRAAGKTLGEARGCHWFYQLLTAAQRGRDEEVYFLVAALMAQATHTDQIPAAKSVGAALARLKQERKRDGAASNAPSPIERRFGILLDAEFSGQGGGELAYRLRQVARMADQQNVALPWAELLKDLLSWGVPGKRVQKRWAADFYAPYREGSPSGEPAPAADTSTLT